MLYNKDIVFRQERLQNTDYYITIVMVQKAKLKRMKEILDKNASQQANPNCQFYHVADL